LIYFELLVFTICFQEVEVRYLLALIQLFANENPEYQKGDLTCFREKLIYF